jgi:DNA-binding GntR family transcriptional regulator
MKSDAPEYDFLAAPLAPVRGNITAAVTEALRRAIVSLEIKPGAAIDKAAICARFGVSRFPVSEALARLRAEGLVEIWPQRGSTASRVKVADVLEYMLIRRALETEAVALLAGTASPELIASLRENLARHNAAVEINDGAAAHIEDVCFHAAICDALSLPRLKQLVDGARSNLDRARRLISSPRRLALTLSEHAAIVDALETGSAEAAATAMRRHLDAVIVTIVEVARRQPELFGDGAEDFTHRFATLFPPR